MGCYDHYKYYMIKNKIVIQTRVKHTCLHIFQSNHHNYPKIQQNPEIDEFMLKKIQKL